MTDLRQAAQQALESGDWYIDQLVADAIKCIPRPAGIEPENDDE